MFRGFKRITPAIASLMTVAALSMPAFAQDDPSEFLTVNSEKILNVIKDNRDSFKEDPLILETALLGVLEPVVDFNAFSRGVMGPYYKEASPAQREKFITAFQTTLIDLYTQGLVETEVADIEIEDVNRRSENSASVSTRVTSVNNNKFMIAYSLRRKNEADWKIRNVIAEGVNVGLTYRNQFKSAMDTENNDLDRVIELWPEIIGNNKRP